VNVSDAPAFASALEPNAAVFVALMLEQPAPDPAALRGLAELCRKAGALDEARQLYARLAALVPADAKAGALAQIFDGRASPPPPTATDAWPTRFVRVLDFLPADLHAQVLALTLDALPRFVASVVYDHGHGHGYVDPSRRVSSVLLNPVAHSRLFLPRVEAAVDRLDIARVLGLERGRLRRYELQVTCHADGAFFKAHTDSGKEVDRHRAVSFVYYFHGVPKRFRGGGLLLFDAAMEVERYARTEFTRIEPTNNSIVFFPSPAVHEVEAVTVETRTMADGRFSLNGWISDDG
jgi:hypothetical protein